MWPFNNKQKEEDEEDEYPKTKEKTEELERTYYRYKVTLKFVSGREETVSHEGAELFNNGILELTKVNLSDCYVSSPIGFGDSQWLNLGTVLKGKNYNLENIEEWDVKEKQQFEIKAKVRLELEKRDSYDVWSNADYEILEMSEEEVEK